MFSSVGQYHAVMNYEIYTQIIAKEGKKMDCKPCQNNHPFKNANQMLHIMPENYDQQTPEVSSIEKA